MKNARVVAACVAALVLAGGCDPTLPDLPPPPPPGSPQGEGNPGSVTVTVTPKTTPDPARPGDKVTIILELRNTGTDNSGSITCSVSGVVTGSQGHSNLEPFTNRTQRPNPPNRNGSVSFVTRPLPEGIHSYSWTCGPTRPSGNARSTSGNGWITVVAPCDRPLNCPRP